MYEDYLLITADSPEELSIEVGGQLKDPGWTLYEGPAMTGIVWSDETIITVYAQAMVKRP